MKKNPLRSKLTVEERVEAIVLGLAQFEKVGTCARTLVDFEVDDDVAQRGFHQYRHF
jgi:hypothetical protein